MRLYEVFDEDDTPLEEYDIDDSYIEDILYDIKNEDYERED